MPSDEQRRMLGAFVRARREGMAPQGPSRRRRTPGLRREELAQRAGIGTTWIAWIEQGRDVRPAAETLSRLAHALCLSTGERDYLFALAGRGDPEHAAAGPGGDAPAALAAAAGALHWPAYVLDPAWSVCAPNAAARALFVGLFDPLPGPRCVLRPNLLLYVFTHPAARTLLPDWAVRAQRVLAEFRRDYGRTMADPRVAETVDWLLAHSDAFREGWHGQEVQAHDGGPRAFLHPERGLLHFTQHTLTGAERDDFRLVFLQPLDEPPLA